MQVMPNYFLIRINKEEQKEFKLKVAPGSKLYQAQTNISNTKGLERGEIVQIGTRVLKSEDFYGAFDKCKVGDTLIIHWDIEAEHKGGNEHLLFQDEIYNYYVVPEREVRGYYDGKKITPHPKYVFLKDLPLEEEEGATFDRELGSKITTTESGLILFSDWGKSKKKLEEHTEAVDARMKTLGRMNKTEELTKEFGRLQKEKSDINRLHKKKEVLPYRIAYSSKKLDIDCGIKLKEDDIAHVFNYAANYKCNFQLHDYQYIIALVEYVCRVEQKEMATA